MFSIILAGPGNSWLPILGLTVAFGVLTIGVNAVWLKLKKKAG